MATHSTVTRRTQSSRITDHFTHKAIPNLTMQKMVSFASRILLRNGCIIFLVLYVFMMSTLFVWMFLENSHVINAKDSFELSPDKVRTTIPLGIATRHDQCLLHQQSRKMSSFFKFSKDLYLQPAFKDDRSSDGTIIRIFGLSRTKVIGGYCLVDNTESGKTEVASMLVNYISPEDYHKNFRSVSITCRLGVTLVDNPCYVFLSNSSALQQSNIKIPLHSIRQEDPQHSYTVCLAVLAGPVAQSTLVEFIEFHKILGADHFYIYQYVGDSLRNESNINTDTVLNHYNNVSDFVTSVQWKLPVQKKSVYHLGQSLAKQHCLYHNMMTSQFVFFPNVYQYLIPQDATNWFNLLRPLTKPPSTKFCFQAYYFPPEAGDLLLTMSSLNRFSRPNREMLCFIPPQHVDLADDHIMCKDNRSHLHVDVSKGFVHDYHHGDHPYSHSKGLVPTTTVTKFKYELQIAFKRTMNLIFRTQMAEAYDKDD